MHKDRITVKGFGRVQRVNAKTGKIEGDSGWKRNTITESGFDDAIVGAIGGIAASSQFTHLQIGTQTNAIVSTQVALSGEHGDRIAVTPTLVGAGTLQALGTWATSQNNASSSAAIAAYGSSSGSSCLNGILFTASSKTTDQQMVATMQWQFS